MKPLIKEIFKKVAGVTYSPQAIFHSYEYLRHNQRRLEHLASLGLPIAGATVLELGAGIGDHTSFFLNRSCQVLLTDAREDNLEILRSRYPNLTVKLLDMDNQDGVISGVFDIVYCYGLLYHLKNPGSALEHMEPWCRKMLLLETCVSFGDEDAINPCAEDLEDHSQSFWGTGCRPTRVWVYNRLKQLFPFVYMPLTQPNHEQFPLDWSSPPSKKILTRAVFIASKVKLVNDQLVEYIPRKQIRH